MESTALHKPTIRKRRTRIPALLTFGILAGLFWYLIPHRPEQNLLRLAVKVADATDWEFDGYDWMNNSALLSLSGRRAGPMIAIEVDTRSGILCPLQELSRALSMHGVNASTWIGGVKVLGPTGPVWFSSASNLRGSSIVWHGFTMRGVELEHLPVENASDVLTGPWNWLPDRGERLSLIPNSEGLYAIVASATNTADPASVVAIDIKPEASPAGTPDHFLGFDRQDRVITTNAYRGREIAADLFRFPLKPHAKPERWSIKPPPNGYCNDITLSRDGDHIAWMYRVVWEPPYRRFLARWLPFCKSTPDITDELWVSRLDGSQMRRIGAIDQGHDVNILPVYTGPEQLRWSPDGRRISFVYNKGVYVIEVK